MKVNKRKQESLENVDLKLVYNSKKKLKVREVGCKRAENLFWSRFDEQIK